MDVKKHQKSELFNLLPPRIRSNIKTYIQMENLYEAAIKAVCTKLEILDCEYESRFERNPIHHIENRIKSPESIFRKLRKYGHKVSLESAMVNIYDIAGIRVICYYISDVYAVYDTLSRQDDIKVIEIRDYIKEPKVTGYRSLHLIVEVPVHTIEDKKMVLVEIQIRTMAMDYFASVEHQLKYKSGSQISSLVNDELTKCAQIITQTDEIMENICKRISSEKSK